MVIHQKQVTARKQHTCSTCYGRIAVNERYWRVFGMAEAGDKPSRIKVCTNCKSDK